jgi:hypothetical protein
MSTRAMAAARMRSSPKGMTKWVSKSLSA